MAVLVSAVAATTPADRPASASPAQASHVDNPYLGVKGYVNPEWKAHAEQTPAGARVSNTPTSVWIDSIAKLIGDPAGAPGTADVRGLRGHLDAAIAQGAGYIQFVINNLPEKDCDQPPETGEFQITDLDRYQREFIDPIAAIESDPKYRSLRVINIVEPRWVRNLVVNTGARAAATERCEAVREAGTYLTGVRYAVTRLHQAAANVYTYLDAGSYDQLGWADNFGVAVALIAETVRGTPDGFASVDGFATNIAGYAPVKEPYFTIETKVGGKSVRLSTWVDWNDYVDERPYALGVRAALVRAGFGPQIGMVIDTSRNGWGGQRRPTGASTATGVSTFVDASRIDRRPHTWNWCNQIGAGLGERPTAAPGDGVDAYAWIKTPGESDGVSPREPVEEAKGFDLSCGSKPVETPVFSGPTGAMPGAPQRGSWFPAAFAELLANAYPPLP